MTDIKVPNVGESVTEVTIAQWFKAEGDAVKKDEPLVELETDKAAQELVAPEDGVLTSIKVAEGENAEVGQLIAVLGAGSGEVAGAPSAAKPEEVQASAVPSDSGNASLIDIVVPNVGESVTEATLATWMKKQGDSVEKDEALLELETDKAAQELVSPAAGVLAEVLVGEDETVTPGTILGRIRAGAGASKATPNVGTDSAAETNSKTSSDKDPMPAASRVIKEQGLDASAIDGTGRDGRITKGDALKAAKAPKTKPAPQAVPREVGAREERVRMSRLRQTIARRLKGAQDTAAILTTFNEADMTEIMATRSKYKELFIKKHGIKLGFMSFFVKAVCTALKEIPSINAEIDGTDIIYKNFYDIGVAVGTDKGLVVPVLRDADTLSLAGIEKGIADLGAKARDGDLSMADMSGGTFTISNGGVYGSLMSTPILNPPQSGILGMHTIQQRPMAVGGEVKIRPMMYLALSYDHRIVDGKEAVTFLVRVKQCLENPERMLLDL